MKSDFTADWNPDHNSMILSGTNNDCPYKNCTLLGCNGIKTTADNQLWVNNKLVEYDDLSEDAKEIIDSLRC